MPVVRISEKTNDLLKMLSKPLEDNYDTVIGRLAETALAGSIYEIPTSGMLASQAAAAGAGPTASVAFPRRTDLAHTRIITAEIDGVAVQNTNWNALAKKVHAAAFKKLGSLELVRRNTRARIRDGKYEDQGFSYIPDVDFSIQAVDANSSWDNTVRIAKATGMSVRVTFEWYDKPKAFRPGETDTVACP